MEASNGIILGNVVSLMEPVAALDGPGVAFGAGLAGCRAATLPGGEGVTEANQHAVGFNPGREQRKCRQ